MIKNLDEIRERSDITKIIGDYVDLKRSGTNYVGCCPFHQEKSPSFTVSANRQTYHCFGCGASGDVFQFLVDHKRLEFVDAVEEVAKQSGAEIEFTGHRAEEVEQYKQAKAVKETLYDVMERVTRLLTPTWDDTEAPYPVEVAGRVYSGETIRTFRLGYAPKGRIFTYADLEGLQISQLVSVGVLAKSKKNDGHYEVMAGRDIFPIRDERGRVVSLAGRAGKEAKKDTPKYLNGAESPIYNKSKLLYGLDVAGKYIRSAGRCIVVEGYTDVLTLHEAEIRNVVGTCGTALTEDQAKLLARYTDNVTLLMDGDPAGEAATAKAVEILCPHVSVKVAFFPPSEAKVDPDMFVRENGSESVKAVMALAMDGVIWAAKRLWSGTDLYAQRNAIETAAKMLAKMDNGQRSGYIRLLASKAGLATSIKAELQEAIEQYTPKKETVGVWAPQEEETITHYSIYVRDGAYYLPSGIPGIGSPLSNFVISAMTLVVGNAASERIIELKHTTGRILTARIESDIFTSFPAFQTWVESQGNYYFYDTAPKFWGNIRRFVIDQMRTVYPVTKLGWHREGFFVWKNGITMGNGQFQPVGPGGIVEHGGILYMLTMAVDLRNELADDGGGRSDNNYFKFPELSPRPDFITWGRNLITAYGDNGTMGIGFVIASLFRDIVQGREGFFPLLNIFGSPGTGKTKLFEMLLAFWGEGAKFYDLTNTTAKALPRLLTQRTNAVVPFDEYRSELDDDIHAVLTGAYNGAGRDMAAYDGSTKTNNFEVTSAVLLAGEHRPTKRMALYTRCIALETHSTSFNLEQINAYDATRDVARGGGLAHVIADLLRFRPQMIEGFAAAMKEMQQMFRQSFRGRKIESRLIDNYSVICAVASVIQDAGFELPFKLINLMDISLKGIEHQSDIIGSEDPLAAFWRIIASLYEQRRVRDKEHVIFSELNEVTIIKGGKGNDTETISFPDIKKVLFIRIEALHGEYLQTFAAQTRGTGLQIGTLQHYLSTSASCIGKIKSKKFGSSTLSCWAFDMEKLPVEFAQKEEVH